jgi:polyisoprenyl-teichoic acid--peptidoglycan teichoic acid transferase
MLRADAARPGADRPPDGGPGRRQDGQGGRALLAAALSAIVPGAGQLYARRPRRALLMLAVTGAFLGAAAVAWNDRASTARLLLQPRWLLVLLAVDASLLAFRVWSVADAFWLGLRRSPPGPRARRWPLLLAFTVLLLMTATPHPVAAWYDLQAYDLVTSVFSGDPSGQAHGGQRANVATRQQGRLTVLLLGGDAGYDRQGLRTDTMIVATTDLATGRTTLFGLPRNMVQVPLTGRAGEQFGCQCFPRPLNELYAFGQLERPDLFPGQRPPGVTALIGAAEALLGLPIDHYALVDLQGFVDVVDALGGVTVTVTKPVRVEIDQLGRGDGGPAYTLRPGRRHLDGLTALAYVRARKETSDYDRMRRQRCLLGAVAGQVDAPTLLRGFPRLVRTLKRDVQTDLPLDRLTGLIELADDTGVQVATIGITPPAFTDGYANGYPIPDVQRIRRAVRRAVRGPAPTTTTSPADAAAGPTTTAGGAKGGQRRPTATTTPPGERADGSPSQTAESCTEVANDVTASRR